MAVKLKMKLLAEAIALADWRRNVAELYSAVRHHTDPEQAWHAFRAGRDSLFKSHPQSPLTAAQKADFISLPYPLLANGIICGNRNTKGKRAARSRITIDADFTTMLFDDGLDDAQP